MLRTIRPKLGFRNTLQKIFFNPKKGLQFGFSWFSIHPSAQEHSAPFQTRVSRCWVDAGQQQRTASRETHRAMCSELMQ